MEDSLKKLDEYLEKIGRSEFVIEEQNDLLECESLNGENVNCGVHEKSNEIYVKKEKSNTVDDSNESPPLFKANEKSITFTRDFTPNLHNRNDSYIESQNGNTNDDHVSVPDDTIEAQELSGTDFINNVKTESLHFEESEEAVNELEEIGLNKQSLQNYATLGIGQTIDTENRKNDELVHPVALKKSAIFFREPEPVLQPRQNGQVTTLLDISSITELKRLWVRQDNADKRVNIASSKQIRNKCNLPVPKNTSKSMHRHRPIDNSDVKKEMINIRTNTKVSNRSRSEETDNNRNRTVIKNIANYQTKQCTVKLVRLEDLRNQVKIDLFCPTNCIPVKLENSITDNLEVTSLIKNTEPKKQILKKIRAISNIKNLKLNRKTKTMIAIPKRKLGTSRKNAKQRKKTCLIETAAKKVGNKFGIVSKDSMKGQANCEEVSSVQDQMEISKDVEGESYMIVKSESVGKFDNDDDDDDDGNDDDDYVPSDDEKDDDYHPKQKLKKSKTRRRQAHLVKNNFAPKHECDYPCPDGGNYTKSKKVKGTRIGRPPVFGHFECKLCDFTANEKNLIDKHHYKTHRQVFECEPCNKIFKSNNRFLEHNAYVHDGGKPFKCDHEGCPYASKNPTDLSRHQAKHETELRHVCAICGWRTKWRRNMRHHNIMKHCDERKYQCTICDFAAKRKQDLKQHLYRHSDKKPIQCLTCGFRVKTNFELSSHMLVHTNEKPFKCTFPGCLSGTKTKSDLNKHMRIHQTERPFKCDICSKTYKDQVALNKHRRGIHVEGRKFNCDICGKKFKNRYALKKHVLLHSGFKPYDCSVCGWKFTTRSNLDKHMVTHDTKDRPYLCPICPYAAKVTDHLLSHIGSFHGDKYAYFCELCSKPFKRYMQLKIHYERMHSKEEVENLKKPGNADSALLKIEMKLELEEEEAGMTRKRKNSSKNKAVSETDMKTGPLNENYSDTISNVNEDFDNVRLNENTDLIEEVKKRKLNYRSSIEREESHEGDGNMNVESYSNREGPVNTGGNTLIEKSDRDGNEGGKDIDNMIETDGSNCQKQEDEIYVKDEEKTAENILIAKDERRTVAFCNNLRLPLATRGFKFNYDKTGKKPANSWFMDTSLMDKETAERHRKHGRRVGLLPPIPRGHPPKGYKKPKKFVDKRKKRLTEKIENSKCTKELGHVARRNAPRSTRYSNRYTEFEPIEDEMLSVERDHERLPSIKTRIDTIKEIPEESQSFNVEQTETKSQSEKLNKQNETKDIVKEKKVVCFKLKKLSEKTGLKTSKLLLSTERRKRGKILKIRKPAFLDKKGDNTLVKEVNERNSVAAEINTLSESSQNGSASAGSDNKIGNETLTQHETDTHSMSETVWKKDSKNGIGKVKGKQVFLKKIVQQRLKHLLLRKKGELGKGAKNETLLKKKNVIKVKKNIFEKIDFSTDHSSFNTLHVPLKDTQLVMVYPKKNLQNTGTGVFASVNEGNPSTVTDHETYSERVDIKEDPERLEIKEDLDVAVEDAANSDSNVVKGGNSDKDIMQQEYLALFKEEPGLEC